MHVHFLIFGVLMATNTAAAEPLVFHKARFPDATTVSLSLISKEFSAAAGFDFDVTIALTEMDGDGVLGYLDFGRHRARVRCSQPASVYVGGTDYAVPLMISSHDLVDWKLDLWRTVCTVPTS